MKIDQREALRYLGYKGSEPDAEILHTIADCARELEESATPHHILQAVRTFPAKCGYAGICRYDCA